MQTVKEIAEKRGVKAPSLARTLNRKGFEVGVNDVVTMEMINALNGDKPLQINGTKNTNVPKNSKPKKAKASKKTGLFDNRIIVLVAASILIASDALSFAWIAINTYSQFKIIAGVMFAFVGMAVGYSAIKNIVSYDGWNGDSWAWGFALFQIALHLSAMQVFDEFGANSFFIGKIVISFGLALATAGLAVALRTK